MLTNTHNIIESSHIIVLIGHRYSKSSIDAVPSDWQALAWAFYT